MKIRGQRECNECGTRWSYYDTGEVSCPDCGSLRSVGVDEARSLHTATTATLDLTSVRGALDEEPLRSVAARAADRCRTFTRGYGFVDAGELQPLDDTYLAAVELQYVGSELARRVTVDDDEAWYFTELLRASEGERPEPADVPDSLRGARGLACANAVREYRSDVRSYLTEQPRSIPAVDRVLERLGEHVKRIRALDGNVPPRDAERLVATARDVGRYLLEDDEGALAEAASRLDDLV